MTSNMSLPNAIEDDDEHKGGAGLAATSPASTANALLHDNHNTQRSDDSSRLHVETWHTSSSDDSVAPHRATTAWRATACEPSPRLKCRVRRVAKRVNFPGERRDLSRLAVLPSEVVVYIMSYFHPSELLSLRTLSRSMLAQIEDMREYKDWLADKFVSANHHAIVRGAEDLRQLAMGERTSFFSIQFANSPRYTNMSVVNTMLNLSTLAAEEAAVDYSSLPTRQSKVAHALAFTAKFEWAHRAHGVALREARRRVGVTWVFRTTVLLWFCTVCRIGFTPLQEEADDSSGGGSGASGNNMGDEAWDECAAQAMAMSLAVPLLATALFLAAAMSCNNRVRFRMTVGSLSCSSKAANCAVVWMVTTLATAALAFRNCSAGCWVCGDEFLRQEGFWRTVMVYFLTRPMCALFVGVVVAIVVHALSLAACPRRVVPPRPGDATSTHNLARVVWEAGSPTNARDRSAQRRFSGVHATKYAEYRLKFGSAGAARHGVHIAAADGQIMTLPRDLVPDASR